jgi:vacuolar-type H+-ATPase subunit C/Vma6
VDNLDVLRPTGNYEYVNALVRGQIGNLLRLHDYEAILGCTRPSDLIHVLNKTSYGELLQKTEDSSFTTLKESLTSTISKTLDTLIASSPDNAKTLLQEYRLLLESKSIVNSMATMIGEDIIADAGIVPLGALPPTYYQQSELPNKEQIRTLQTLGLDAVISESLELARIYKCMAPLHRIITFCATRFWNIIHEISSQDQTSLTRLNTSTIDGANLEIIITSLLCHLEPQIFSSWLSEENLRQVALKTRSIDQIMIWVTNSRYGPCAKEESGGGLEVMKYGLSYCMMSHEAHSTLAGYPFRASTIAAGMVMKLLEIRNIRLAIAGASGELKRAVALRLMIMP